MNNQQPTFSDRMKAARIIADMRAQISRGDMGRILGIDPTYVSFIENKTRRYDNPEIYIAPEWTIKLVLEWGRRNGKL